MYLTPVGFVVVRPPAVSETNTSSPTENADVFMPEIRPNIIASPSSFAPPAASKPSFRIPMAGILLVPLLSASFTSITLPDGGVADGAAQTTWPFVKATDSVFFTLKVKDRALSVSPTVMSA